MFQKGDIVTCVDCAEEQHFDYSHRYKMPFPDDYQYLTLGENYTVLSHLERLIGLNIIHYIILEEFQEIRMDGNLFTKRFFNINRFELNIKETRRKKIDELNLI
jgi:hypothetical protein